jgi:hypothetical protein
VLLEVFLITSSKQWATWPLGKLYKGRDASENQYKLHSEGCKYARGPEGYPYSAHLMYSDCLSYLALRRKNDCLLAKIRQSFSITVFVYLTSHRRHKCIVDFRTPKHYQTGGNKGVIMFVILQQSLLRFRVTSPCEGPKMKLVLRKWHFVSGSYDSGKKRIRVSVGDSFREKYQCQHEPWECSRQLHIANSPHRTFEPRDPTNFVKLACLQIHDYFLSKSDVLNAQVSCLGRGEYD